MNLYFSSTLSLRMDVDRNRSPVWLNFRNAFIPLDKMNSRFIGVVEVNQTGAVAREIE